MTAQRRPPTLGRILLDFFGSMPFAITLLVAVAVASIIGTVLQQNQPYTDYVIKFGPFWFEVFRAFQLYDIYHAPWFLFLLAFLVVSTTTCIYLNTPKFLRDMRSWRLNITDKSLRALSQRAELGTALAPEEAAGRAAAVAAAAGYRSRLHRRGDGSLLVAARRGGANRLGYLLTHAAIVVIAVGGLLDGNLPILFGELLGKVRVETRDLTVGELPPESFLPEGNPSFRGNITIPEGQAANFLFVNVRDGYLVQRLPFSIEVKDFRIEHYDNGQPKSFESDLVIYDSERPQPLAATISVNHPLTYRGVTIYQASFGDGGSRLKLRAWPLRDAGRPPFELEGKVNGDARIETSDGPYVVEFVDFRKFNIHDVSKVTGKKKFKNVGPSFQYKLRRADGRALEFNNYMSPVDVNGRPFFLTGVRTSPAEEFRYLYFPADAQGGLGRFMAFVRALHDPRALRLAAEGIAEATLRVGGKRPPGLREQIVAKTVELGGLFARGGFEAIEGAAREHFPPEKRKGGFQAYMNIVRVLLAELYQGVLQAEGSLPAAGPNEAQQRFYEDAITAFLALPNYDVPVYLQLLDYTLVEATGLELTRSPGKYVVYLGCALLIAGVFMLFYIHHRRLWIHIRPAGEGAAVLLGGSDTRRGPDFEREFAQLRERLTRHLEA